MEFGHSECNRVNLHVFLGIFIKETYFCDKLFASLGHKALLKLVYLLHSEWPKLHRVVAILSAIGLNESSHF